MASVSFSADVPSSRDIENFLKSTGLQVNIRVLGTSPSPINGLIEIHLMLSTANAEAPGIIYFGSGKYLVGNIFKPSGENLTLLAMKAMPKPVIKPIDVDVSGIKLNGVPRGSGRKGIIVEFSDFQCPYCKEASPTIDKLARDGYKVYYKHLPSHPLSDGMAMASVCAGKHFWSFHDAFFAKSVSNEKELNSLIARLVRQDRIDAATFKRCMKTAGERVKEDVREAKAIGIAGTPTVILFEGNGRGKLFSGVVSMEEITKQDTPKAGNKGCATCPD